MINTNQGATASSGLHPVESTERVLDCISFAQSQSWQARLLLIVLALSAGAVIGTGLDLQASGSPAQALTLILWPLAFCGGLLSTWSPCGYSSLSLLRPQGSYSARSVLAWLPTILMHALGYLAGALLLGALLGGVGALLSAGSLLVPGAIALALLAFCYGAHQFDFLRMPYPQRRAQVPHDARFRFRSWVIGLLYGFALGTNYSTYVQTPILYIVTLAAALSGDIAFAIATVCVFNAGRFFTHVGQSIAGKRSSCTGFFGHISGKGGNR
ncbi:methylamine utilization protein MauF [Advenella mimigardefordensis]|uniref:Methylamine utilization protein MauF n=1 Tax=Advenella mimigardefordensis (strain DSM 17166 / LMG 22922 / DPN7) TaxID=1247726 RepID=W0PGV2_ADVMD|nr:methylamine utilization protein MauF [Advenella mimigardefordensis]AHG65042.1 methylamine utilization protein MauF [Advenella mimigardefordensis DPN7]